MKHYLGIYGPAALLVLAGFVIAFQFVRPAPPDHVTFAAGSPDGVYYKYAHEYARLLAKEGIHVKVLATAGSVQNIGLLQQGKADIALVQGGIEDHLSNGRLLSLGSVYYEPLWLFHSAGHPVHRLTDLAGLKVAVGTDGSGTRALVMRLLRASGVQDSVRLETIGGSLAADALQAGKIDAAFFVISPKSEVVQRLLHDPKVALTSFEQAAAYARLFPFLNDLTLPEGIVDLRQNIPSKPITLLGPAANLVVRGDIHPALIDLFLQAAERVHSKAGWFHKPGEFPQPALLSYPLAPEARRYYRDGPPFLQRYLPFWAASLLDRLKVMLVPLVLMLLPFFKVMPPIYTWRMSSRIYRWYDQLQALDARLPGETPAEHEAIRDELDRLEADVLRINVPLSFARQLYHLRDHIDLVKRRLRVADGD